MPSSVRLIDRLRCHSHPALFLPSAVYSTPLCVALSPPLLPFPPPAAVLFPLKCMVGCLVGFFRDPRQVSDGPERMAKQSRAAFLFSTRRFLFSCSITPLPS